ncbi:MAG: CpsD/CapB family tyrosine-protein kinase, partial [Edaphobacter sp.]
HPQLQDNFQRRTNGKARPMSRIYEALQKAESERTLEPREREPRTPSQPSSAEPLSQTAVAEAGFESPAVQPPALQPAGPRSQSSPSLAPAPAIADALDLSQVVRRPWSPAFAQLPSLLKRGPGVEQFRSLRSRIFELRDVSPLKSILISSGLPQEGKSFISSNLAMSLARHKNSKVLLIDGDMRRYSMHQILGCESQPGLADYLAGKASIVEIMQRPELSSDTQQPLLPNLTFIAGGNGGDRAADLSGSPRFGELIRLASPHFDWIIVDSSPVLPVSDAVNLARACDGVLLVARGGVTKYPVAQRAQSELKASKILGFVLNAVQEAPQVGSYYGYDSTND